VRQRQAPTIIQLAPATLDAFREYVRDAEAVMRPTLQPAGQFLWCEESPKREQQVLKGEIEAQHWAAAKPAAVPHGLIHDWIGAAFAPEATITQTLAMVQDYDNHKNIYKPEVVDSKLLNRHGNKFHIYLRLLKKRIITVVLDTDHEVRYQEFGPTRWFCCSYTTRIAEVEDAGTPKELVLPPDTGYGFMWRLYSYWRFEEKDGGVFLECRAMSLSRDIPLGLGWIIEPIVRKLPRESLVNTLAATKNALAKPNHSASTSG
jgi:hypothetical protein